MKKLLLLCLLFCTLGGCYYSYEETPSPDPSSSVQSSGTAENTPTPAPTTPELSTPAPEGKPSTGGLYAQNVNVSHDGFVYRVNGITITKDTAELPPEGPIAKFLERHTLQEDESYLLVNTTITNPFDTPCRASLRGWVIVLDEQYDPAGNDCYMAMVFDQTQHPKSNTYWFYTFEAKEAITTNHLFVLQDADLEKNLCSIRYDPSRGATGARSHTYILLQTADESALPNPPITEDAPPPSILTTELTLDRSAEPKVTPKPGQIVKQGEDVIHGDLQYRLNDAQAVMDFQGSDWCPLSEYEEFVSWLRRGAPDAEPCAVIVNMTITNLSDAPVQDCLSLYISSIPSPNDPYPFMEWFGESLAYDLRNPFKQMNNYYYRTLKPGETVTVNYLYAGDVGELKRDFRMKIDPLGFTDGDSVRYIDFRVKE